DDAHGRGALKEGVGPFDHVAIPGDPSLRDCILEGADAALLAVVAARWAGNQDDVLMAEPDQIVGQLPGCRVGVETYGWEGSIGVVGVGENGRDMPFPQEAEELRILDFADDQQPFSAAIDKLAHRLVKL